MSLDELLFVLSLGFYIFYAQTRQQFRATLTPDVIIVLSFPSFLLLIGYLLAGQLGRGVPAWRRPMLTLKYLLLLTCIALLVGTGVYKSAMFRHETAPWRYIQDNALQEEIAVERLLDGQNPYAIDFLETDLERWSWNPPTYDFKGTEPPLSYEVNPALYHVAYLPFSILAHLPFRALSVALIGWYDARLLYFATYLASLTLGACMVRGHQLRLSWLAGVGLNPLLAFFVVEGRGDSVSLFLIALTLCLVQRNRAGWSAVALGLACATRHQVWFLVPFWMLYLYLDRREQGSAVGEAQRMVARHTAAAATVALLVILPFFAADPASFVDDTVGYLSGSAQHPYPISGVGFGGLTLVSGWSENSLSLFPFWILQLLVGVPILGTFLLLQTRRNSLALVAAGYAVTLLGTMLFSRFFKDNYAGYVVVLLTLAFVLDQTDGQYYSSGYHAELLGNHPASLDVHPLVGTQLAMANPPLPDAPQYAAPSLLAADETVLLMAPSSHVGPQSDASGTFLGTVTVDGYSEVSDDGQTFIDDGSRVTVTIRDPADAIVQQFPGAGGRPVRATRMGVGTPGFPQGTPAAGTPTF